jgi:heme/copper-type cytochrome/quinol oxidase subunit 2
MSLIHAAVVVAAEAEHNPLPMPPIMFGLITFAVFLLLALVVWSYRDVANRHSQVSGRPGGDGSGHTAAKDG